jgi:hypothetical protein
MKIKKHIDGNWYEPTNYLSNLPSVVRTVLCDTTSSAGDWSGMFVKKQGNKYQIYSYSQANSYPYSGFDLHISLMLYNTDKMPSDEQLSKDWEELTY